MNQTSLAGQEHGYTLSFEHTPENMNEAYRIRGLLHTTYDMTFDTGVGSEIDWFLDWSLSGDHMNDVFAALTIVLKHIHQSPVINGYTITKTR